MRQAKRFLDPNTFIVCGHRGYSGKYPENTILAFTKAVEFGALAVEIDIRVSKDGVVVVMHDETVERTTNGNGRVDELTWDELSALDAGGWFDPEFQDREDCRVPRLSDVIDALKDTDAVFELDIKDTEALDLAVAIARQKAVVDRTIVVGPEAVANYAAQQYPEFVTYRGLPYTDVNHHIRNAKLYGHEVISWNRQGLTSDIAAAVHDSGRLLRVSWIDANNATLVQQMVNLGVNIFLTDWIETTVQVLQNNSLVQSYSPPRLRPPKSSVV